MSEYYHAPLRKYFAPHQKGPRRKVACGIHEDCAENDDGIEVDCVYATCSKCGHETMSFGTDEASIKRCLWLMNEECPRNERNWYEVSKEHGANDE